jgi:hypothetical protein
VGPDRAGAEDSDRLGKKDNGLRPRRRSPTLGDLPLYFLLPVDELLPLEPVLGERVVLPVLLLPVPDVPVALLPEVVPEVLPEVLPEVPLPDEDEPLAEDLK